MSDPIGHGTTKLGDGYQLSWRPMLFGGTKIRIELKGNREKHLTVFQLKSDARISMACWAVQEGAHRNHAIQQVMKGINIAYSESGGSAEMEEGVEDATQEKA